ncbi:hypothetical protein H257_08256 [Aphanomyces astaci]|uniref:Myotubularin-related 12-like C-terminal domain-containing protein n=1 Tax=Aphanomyces astaci TaxID=112090 RepID=W4GFL4_APHAT|nr:hypothetical protein H257_08256 [Aphanomyces astaci]ETV78041.1 hypothetical protein H257_08256 [Aphanomyces astaci]|eukprot:XP_009832378.1 hypothetical protein H257_08256 [Aphanomyces astaci]
MISLRFSSKVLGRHGLVGLEEKEDGVVLVHTDSSQQLEALASPHRGRDAVPPLKVPDEATWKGLPSKTKPPKKKIHSIVQDLDTGLMFPHVIETVASPLPSPAAFARMMDYSTLDDDDLEFLPRNDQIAHGKDDSSSSSSDESEGSQASSKDVRSFGPDADVLVPSVSVKCLRLWTEYYLRWDATATIDRHGELEREAKLRDVLGELEYYKKQQRKRESGETIMRRGGIDPRPRGDDRDGRDDENDMVGLAMEDLFEVESRQVMADLVASPSPTPTKNEKDDVLTADKLSAHNHQMEVADLQARHRVAIDRMQMQYEDYLSQRLQR